MTPTITLSTEDYQALLAEQQRLASQLRLVTVERDLLKERVDAFLHRLYAAKSEARANPAQRDLFLNEAEVLAPNGAPIAEEATPETVEVTGHNRKKRGRKPLDPHLPREIVRHELPESERICGHDGALLVEIGAEISEQLDIVPQQVRVIQHHRVKYACPCCDESIRVTPAPVRIIPKGLLTETALAWVVTAKYQDSLPLYRQAALLSRFGGDLSRNTLAANHWGVRCNHGSPAVKQKSSSVQIKRLTVQQSMAPVKTRSLTCKNRLLDVHQRSSAIRRKCLSVEANLLPVQTGTMPNQTIRVCGGKTTY